MTPAPGRLAVRRRARRDVAEAFRWYEGKTAGLGHEFLRAVAVAFAAIDRDPERFPIALDDIRKVVVARFPYVVYYAALPEGPTVIAVVHGRRHQRRWQSRR